MGFKKARDSFQLGKDIQYLKDSVAVQDQINNNIQRNFKMSGWGMIFMACAGFIILDVIDKLDKRLKRLEDKEAKRELIEILSEE